MTVAHMGFQIWCGRTRSESQDLGFRVQGRDKEYSLKGSWYLPVPENSKLIQTVCVIAHAQGTPHDLF